MQKVIPFEKQKGCRFLLFELPGQLLGFQYMSIKKLNWTPPGKSPGSMEVLEFHFDDCIMRISGLELKRLLPMVQSDELFVVRIGATEGEKHLEVSGILCEEIEEAEGMI